MPRRLCHALLADYATRFELIMPRAFERVASVGETAETKVSKSFVFQGFVMLLIAVLCHALLADSPRIPGF